MTWTIWMAGFIVLLTIAALLKRIETRLVLFVAGLVMALFALSPQTALGAFVANMTNKSLITAICSSMGFAAVIAITRCDVHFVGLMVKPLGRLGIFLLPFCMLIASCVAIAIPSAAGCAAALGPTMIPLMVRAGFKPAIAGAAIIGSLQSLLLGSTRSFRPPSARVRATTSGLPRSPTWKSWTSSLSSPRKS